MIEAIKKMIHSFHKEDVELKTDTLRIYNEMLAAEKRGDIEMYIRFHEGKHGFEEAKIMYEKDR